MADPRIFINIIEFSIIKKTQKSLPETSRFRILNLTHVETGFIILLPMRRNNEVH